MASPTLNSILIVLSMCLLARAQAEELNHDEMVCALSGNCPSQFVDRRVRGVTTPVAPRPPLSFDSTINFGLGSAVLTNDAKTELDKIVDVLKDARIKDAVVIISGHTDAKGSETYNQRLSERRALSVKHYFAQRGIDKKRLTAAAYGQRRLLLPKKPFNALNRRVEFRNAKGVASTETIAPLPDDGL